MKLGNTGLQTLFLRGEEGREVHGNWIAPDCDRPRHSCSQLSADLYGIGRPWKVFSQGVSQVKVTFMTA